MIVVSVDLHSAITGEITSLSQVVIDNIGGTDKRGNYRVRAFRRGVDAVASRLAENGKVREGRVLGHRRLNEPVLTLLRKALQEMGY